MVKEQVYKKMGICMKVIGKMVKEMVSEHIIGMMVTDILVIGLKTRDKEKENFGGLMEINI